MLSLDYDPSTLSSSLQGSLYAGKVHYFSEIASTNTAAMQAAADGAEEGSVFLADEQSAGRGRNGRNWHSERGAAILVSVVLRPRIPAAQALWLSLMAGIATHRAIAKSCDLQCDLRWPNDLLAGGRKLSGILTEISAEPERLRFAVIGIGINVNQSSFPPEISHLATSIRKETGALWPRTELLLALLESLEAAYFQALAGVGNASLLRNVEAISSYVRGKNVHVDEAGGYIGITDGLDQNGFLLVRTSEGIRRVLSGGVREI